MGTYPTAPRTDFLAWCEAHADIFVEQAAAIGLTTSQATAFLGATTTARAELKNLDAARQAARNQTVVCNQAFAALAQEASEAVRSIKTFAENSGNPDVYTTAQIPPPAAPTPIGPPGTPFDFRAELNNDGSLSIRWKCTNPAGTTGTVYVVRRRFNTGAPTPTSAWSQVALTGNKFFTDTTIPFGTDRVEYTVYGQRGNLTGSVSPIFVLQFGSVGGPGVTFSEIANPESAAPSTPTTTTTPTTQAA